jgi:hypothetical protein
MDMDISMGKYMPLVHVQVHSACTFSCCMSMPMLDVHVHIACPSICSLPLPCCMPCLCCVFMSVLNGFEQAVWTRTCSMDIDILLRHGDEAWTWACTMDNCVHATCLCKYCISMSMRMSQHMLRVHAHVACPCLCCIYALLHGHEHTARTWTCSMDKDLQHGR